MKNKTAINTYLSTSESRKQTKQRRKMDIIVDTESIFMDAESILMDARWECGRREGVKK